MIKNNLSKIMGEKRINMAELSRISGLNRTTIFQLYHNKTTHVGFDTMDKLCSALNCDVCDLFNYVEG
ncbi:MAG: Cro/Cl family transcriptional regulator [Candidatus Melainabacteria bacterium GWF2_37_15]|nr:MAG: Cro/Cl family transcriptional regulator [Candidatus Melainabacteria bacterium GWF2_37_15]